MELNITAFFNEACPRDYSASVAELGNNAGAYTWHAACEDAPDYNLLNTEEKREAFRDHIREMGAWDDEEIASWANSELNALLIQCISGDIREAEFDGRPFSWDEYEPAALEGIVAGRLFRGDDNEIYYYLGS